MSTIGTFDPARLIRDISAGKPWGELGLPATIVRQARDFFAGLVGGKAPVNTAKPSGGIGRAFWAKSGKAALKDQRSAVNRQTGCLLAVLCEKNPELAAQALLRPFEAAYKDSASRGEIAS